MSMASGIGVTSDSSRPARRRGDGAAAAASGARRRAVVFALACALAVFALLGAAGAAQAGGGTTRTWTGAGLDALWTNPANWDSGAPTPGDSLIFPAAVVSGHFATQNDYAAGTSFGSISIGDSRYEYAGNRITLTGGITTAYVSGIATCSLDVTLTGAQAFSIAGGGGLVCTGAFSGSGALTKSGNGILGLNHDNSGFTGAVTITGGDLEIDDGHALGTGAVTVQSGSRLSFQVAVTVANAVTINGDGILGMGAISALTGASVCTGAITLGSDARIGVSPGSSLELRSIASSYTLSKAGIGPLIVSGTQPFTGAFDVRYGTLQVDGALPSSCEVSVQNGATLSGTGTTGAVTVYAGGTLAPGATCRASSRPTESPWTRARRSAPRSTARRPGPTTTRSSRAGTLRSAARP